MGRQRRPGSLEAVPAYLDHAATTPLRPEALDAMVEVLSHGPGNPSGSHAAARQAKRWLEEARDTVADCLGCEPREVVFTGGGTEADNMAVRGAPARRPGAVVCGATEHHAVLRCTEALGGRTIPVDADGLVTPEAVVATLRALRPADVAVVSVMLVNNEVGTIQPLDEVAQAVRSTAPEALVHTDAVQAVPWLDVGERARQADLVSVSAHKFGGPQGVGALVVRGRADVAPLLLGGGQERGHRSGTQNVAGIVGMAAALRRATADRAELVPRLGRLRHRLVDGILASVPQAHETGRRDTKVAGIAHLRFHGIESEELLFLLDEAGVHASAGSSCASGATEASHVLQAMGLAGPQPHGSVRFSLGWTTTDADVDLALAAVTGVVRRLRRAA